MWETIPDERVRAVWKCEDELCDEQMEAKVSPTFYAEAGVPVCECGEDMTYSHTETKEG